MRRAVVSEGQGDGAIDGRRGGCFCVGRRFVDRVLHDCTDLQEGEERLRRCSIVKGVNFRYGLTSD